MKIINSALVSVVLMAILSVLMYIIGVGDVFILDVKAMVNIAAISLATGLVSLIKSLITTSSGKVAGIKVK